MNTLPPLTSWWTLSNILGVRGEQQWCFGFRRNNKNTCALSDFYITKLLSKMSSERVIRPSTGNFCSLWLERPSQNEESRNFFYQENFFEVPATFRNQEKWHSGIEDRTRPVGLTIRDCRFNHWRIAIRAKHREWAQYFFLNLDFKSSQQSIQ